MPTNRTERLLDGTVLLGVRLREIRKNREERLANVAAAVGLGVAHLSDIERGAKLPSVPALLALADHYELLVTELLEVYPFGVATPPERAEIRPPEDGRLRSRR